MKKTLILMAAALLGFSLSLGVVAKTLRLAYETDPVSLDPHEQLSGSMLQLSHMLFDPLVRWNKEIQFDGRLATSWERLDRFTVRFHLRQGVKFHSGNDFTARDVTWTFNRLKTNQEFKTLFQPVKEIRVVDDYTIDLITDRPYPLVLQLATYLFPMDSAFYTGTDEQGLAKDMLKKHADTFASVHASGTGPFIVTGHQPGERVIFKRFTDYWDKYSAGNVEEIVMIPIKEEQARVAVLLSGEVDFIAPVPPSEHNRIRNNVKVDLVTISGTRIITLQLNQDRRPEFRDRRVRLAIVNAINNEGIVKKIMEGFATPAAQQSPRGYAGHVPDLKPRFDLAKAQQLMQDAGYEKGFSVTMMAPNNRFINDEDIAQAVSSMLSRINIKVDLKTMPKAQYWPAFDERAADIMMIDWHADTEDSANFTEFLAMCPDRESGYGKYNSGNYCNREIDKLAVLSQSETDTAKRAEILQKIEQILYDDAAFVPLHWQDLAWAARKGVHIIDVLNVMNLPYLGDLVID